MASASDPPKGALVLAAAAPLAGPIDQSDGISLQVPQLRAECRGEWMTEVLDCASVAGTSPGPPQILRQRGA